ncbi:Arc family DNA-binding protein [Sinorhizobium fredii]|uniref:Arc family DNA-binding protein n=1 Tax=Rhizobium fredii TaxID=380 RepID=UPI0006948CD8|nr:Arc family DNA-binding protein [Sinorhizobium fredii]
MSEDLEEVRLTLRLPASLRDQLTQEATNSGRSLNAEMVQRLEKSLVEADQMPDPGARVEELWRRFAGIEAKLELLEREFGKDLDRLESRFVDQQVELRILRDQN